jgi:glutamyl-Q tRNA(Asp) synthetase
MLTALASFLEARSRSGEWLVRIEDIDPPRELPGAASEILATLERFGLEWDRSALYQSTRLEEYEAVALALVERGLAFRCSCTRAQLREQSPGTKDRRYPGTCRSRKRHRRATAIRVRADADTVEFSDRLQGQQCSRIRDETGDYVILRRDGLPAYHLAVVLDDAAQGVTDVVRGIDLLESTALHIHLQQTLALRSPSYCHVPVIVNAQGQKLSKQTGALPVTARKPGPFALELLGYLGLTPPPSLQGAGAEELWSWATRAWDITRLRGKAHLPQATARP